MSSQESAFAEQQQILRKKRRRRNNTNRGPPSRLDWMGGGFGLGGQGIDNKIVSQSAAPENDDETTLLTPRADTAIDLTGSDDDRDAIKNGKKKESKKWKCQRCTLQNPQNVTVCGACDARRGSTRNNTKKKNNRNDGDNSDDSEFLAITMKRKSNGSSSSSSTIRKKRSTSTSLRSSKKTLRAAVTAQKKQHQHESKEMWTDKHAPKCTKDLCVAPKKIDEVRQWLVSHSNCRQTKRESSVQSKTIIEEDLDPWEMPDEWETDVLSPDAKLMILVGSPGCGKSSMVHALAADLNLEILTWNDAHHAEFVDYRESHSMDEYLPYQSQMNSFEEFLSAGGAGMDSLELDLGGNDDDDSPTMKEAKKGEQIHGSIILIEEIPNLYNAQAEQSFRNVMERHIQRTIVPTIFIYSDVYEGKHKPEELQRLIPSTILHSNLVQILTIQPATKAKMKKCLQSIAKMEGIGSLTSDFCEEMHLSSGGDMRHAVLAMQFRFSSSSTRQHVGKESTKRDTKLSMFHALGKLIHAKRKPLCQDTVEETKMWDDGRGPLEFDPEDILSRSGMAVGSAVSFLSYHCPHYFTDITEMSRAFDRFSEAGMFVNRFYQGGAGQSTLEYASSIASRAIADSNRTPAPPAFRQLSAPEVFGVMKKSNENEVKMDQLRKRLSLGGGKIALDSNIGSAHRFVTESLPYMRCILPEEVNYALSNLHSYANDSGNNNATEATCQEEALARENEVLLEDDIVDDDDW
ncbi:hypothetical protein ACHAWT_009455 [Skeletonema menzelii]